MRQRLTRLLPCSIRSRRWCTAWFATCCSSGRSSPRGFLVGMRISTCGSGPARKPRSCHNRLLAGKGYGVASAMRFSCTRPPQVSLSKRIVSQASTSRTFFTVWSLVLPLYHAVCAAGSWGRTRRRAVPSWAQEGTPR